MAFIHLNLKKADTDKLLKAKKELEADIQSIKSEMVDDIKYERLSFLISELWKRYHNFDKLASEIYSNPKYRRPAEGVFNKLLKITEQTDEGVQKEKELILEQERLKDLLIFEKDNQYVIQTRLREKLSSKEAFLKRVDQRLGVINRQKLKKLKFETSIQDLKVRARRNEGEVRSMSILIKKQLEVTTECPYCGKELIEGDEHADHIYPVSLGGKPLVGNMVFVCSSCNLHKSNKTLREFIVKFDLNREEIEERLFLLNKTF